MFFPPSAKIIAYLAEIFYIFFSANAAFTANLLTSAVAVTKIYWLIFCLWRNSKNGRE